MSAERTTDPDALLCELQELAEQRGSEAQALAEDAGLPVSERDPTAPVTARILARSLEAELRDLAGAEPAAPRVESALSGIATAISSSGPDRHRGSFTIGPLDKGFGHTFGSTLRRILLTSLPGAAVTAVHLDPPSRGRPGPGAGHEDFTELVLNLKDLVVRMSTGRERVEVPMHADGRKDLRVADLLLPEEVDVLNPQAPIATAAHGAFSGSFLLARGRGYSSAEQNAVGLTNGFVPIDSNFSPILRASYEVATTRVGQRADFDSLRIEIETDGSISPSGALREASKVFIAHLSIFTEPERVRRLLVLDTPAAGPGPAPRERTPAAPARDALTQITIEELELGVRSYNGLRRAGVRTVADLVSRSLAELDAVPNLGRRSIEEVCEALDRLGLGLRSP